MSVTARKFIPFLRGLLLYLLVVNLVTAFGRPYGVSVAHAEVGTDQEDYAPGSVVTVSGKNDANGAPGYVAQKPVDVAVSGPHGWAAACSTSVRADGTWSCAITLNSNPAIAVGDYTYLATSTDVNGSPISETGTFTDGPVSSHTCIVTKATGVKCWGYNDGGQLGDGSTTQRNSPVDVLGLTSGVTQVSTGNLHTCALTTVGGIKCWGDNQSGQLGDGSTTKHTTPVDVLGLTSGVTQVSAGAGHTCALTTNGGVKCWGDNQFGQLGDGTMIHHTTPVDVLGLTSGVTQVSTGFFYTCAVTTSGGVKCWGDNGNSQLGDGTTTQRTTPVDVLGLTSGVTQVSAGGGHTCVLTTYGGIKCWGMNYGGQLGDGTNGAVRTMPADVLGLTSGVTQVSASNNHTCALTMSGGVKCWGANYQGELGDGTSGMLRLTPVDVLGLTSDVTQVSVGSSHTCALPTKGGVKCWGFNSSGQLGDGTTTQRIEPVDVLVGAGGAPLGDVAKLAEYFAPASPEHITITTLDPFNRLDGRLKSPWYGPEGLGGYQIRAQQVAVLGGGPLYWNDKAFGSAQQAAVTLTQLDEQRREHGVMLKVQGNPPNWRKGYIHVYYFADNQTVQVSAYQPTRGIWTDYAPLTMGYINGDQLAAQAWPDGRVRIFRNGFLVGVVQLNVTDQAFYSTRGGRIGLWFNGYGASINATLDDFGGGDISVPAATLSAPNLASTESSISANDGNVPIVTAYTERHYLRGDVLFEQQYLPVLMANSK